MDMTEKFVSTEYIFKGVVVNLRVDTVTTPSGNTATREVVEHPGGVGIVVLTDDNRVIMEKQYRRPLDKITYEIPAGKMYHGEDPRVCGIRELEEETALKAGRFDSLGHLYLSPGFSNERLYLYLARDLSEGKLNLDEDEFIDVEYVPIEKLVDMILEGELKDAKSCVGIMKTYELLRREGKL